jgi:hypothetical protein
MDEARRVLDRLSRIDELRAVRANPAVVLREVRALLAEGEAWLAAERAAGVGERAEHGPAAENEATPLAGEQVGGAGPTGAAFDGAQPAVAGAADALARLDTALTSRPVHARSEEVMPAERAL